ncbi:hypothetical protein U1Q18_017568 [Sarracenia purpurea var. burkii]
MTDMRMRPDRSSGYPGRTYRFYTGRKVFEFGYGLSYSTYSYQFVSVTQTNLRLNPFSTARSLNNSDDDSVRYLSVSDVGSELCEKAKFSAIVAVKNHGEMDGKHPVLLFVRQAKPGSGSPIKRLVGFYSVGLKAGERAEIEFEVSPCEHFSRADEEGLMVVEEGSRDLLVGDESYSISVLV